MQFKSVTQITLIFLVLLVASFDQHFTGYFNSDVITLMHKDALPQHGDNQVRCHDHHEDLTCRNSTFKSIPPAQVVLSYLIYGQVYISKKNTEDVWQPPERN